VAELLYNETTGEYWGASILFQGKYPHSGPKWLPLLVGRTEDEAKDSEGACFRGDKPIPRGKYWLKAKFMLVEREFNVQPDFDDAKGNVGLEFLCQINDLDYDFMALRIAVVFSGFIWNGTGFEEVGKDTYWVQRKGLYDNDIHIAFFVHEISGLNEWQVIAVDLGEIINRAFSLVEEEGVEKITIRGFQLYVEGLGVSVKAKFDYVKTRVNEVGWYDDPATFWVVVSLVVLGFLAFKMFYGYARGLYGRLRIL